MKRRPLLYDVLYIQVTVFTDVFNWVSVVWWCIGYDILGFFSISRNCSVPLFLASFSLVSIVVDLISDSLHFWQISGLTGIIQKTFRGLTLVLCYYFCSSSSLTISFDEYKKHNVHCGYNNRLFSQHAAHIQYNALNNIQRYNHTMNKTPASCGRWPLSVKRPAADNILFLLWFY